MTKVTTDEVVRRIEKGGKVTIVDSRSEDAWNDSDIKADGAMRIPPNDAEKHLAVLDRDDFIVIYCT